MRIIFINPKVEIETIIELYKPDEIKIVEDLPNEILAIVKDRKEETENV